MRRVGLVTPTDVQTAKDLYQKAIKVEPECLEAHINLAWLYIQINEIDLAIQEYDSASEMTSNERDLATIFGFREAAKMRQKVLESKK